MWRKVVRRGSVPRSFDMAQDRALSDVEGLDFTRYPEQAGKRGGVAKW